MVGEIPNVAENHTLSRLPKWDSQKGTANILSEFVVAAAMTLYDDLRHTKRITLPPLQKTFVIFFFNFACKFDIDIFYAFFVVSVSQETKHEMKIRSKIRRKFQKIREFFVLRPF